MTSNTNVDQSELDKFSELASRWWDPNSEFRPLHQINPLRLNWINQRADITGKRVLDVGCGGGILAESMALKGASVLGIDLAEAALSVARLHALETSASFPKPSGNNDNPQTDDQPNNAQKTKTTFDLNYELISAEDCAVNHAASFDVVTCLEMLEHVPEPASTVKACAALVKPGGKLYFSTLNRNAKSWLFAIVGAEYILKLLPKGTHEHKKFITPAELESYCRAAGLTMKDITGLSYNPLTKHYKLGNDIDVNYMVEVEKPLAESVNA